VKMAEIVDFPATGKLPDDLELAQLFASQNAWRWRYVPDWGYWLIWNDEVWARDEVLAIEYDAQMFCAEIAKRLKPKEAARLRSTRGYKAVLMMGRSNPVLTATVDQWDADKMQLNCQGLLIDLSNGEQRLTIATDYVTKSTTVPPSDDDCPLWMEFLDVVTGGDTELIDFLQRMAGYCLTGSTEEQAVFFVYGPGGNGKSTFVNTLSRVMGDYAVNAPMDLLASTSQDRHTEELARLQGARLVTATETQEGRSWDEARLKQLTGGDTITARFMRENSFQFVPVFKLVVSGNHKPGLKGLDDALKRRVRIVPFTVKIPEDKRVRDFESLLEIEWPAILAWAIRGTAEWRKHGLHEPGSVNEATEAYFENEDVLASWASECTTEDSDHFEPGERLFASWGAYCKRSGEKIGTRRRFSDAVMKHPEFTYEHRKKVRGFTGRRLKSGTELLTSDGRITLVI
jgi:putative DNA primase/helicase